jgi:hypothetical protein
MKPRSTPMKTRTGPPSSTPFAWSVASFPPPALFPPRNRTRFHQAVLDEILQERVAARRHRRNLRGVKRKMSNFPLRRPGAPPLHAFNPVDVIFIIK